MKVNVVADAATVAVVLAVVALAAVAVVVAAVAVLLLLLLLLLFLLLLLLLQVLLSLLLQRSTRQSPVKSQKHCSDRRRRTHNLRSKLRHWRHQQGASRELLRGLL